ncbi:MAG: hypothetical protein HY820_08415 [Acidobacteria bacterium]|nr:hypothetical protein [Acidobacteriota bacterium]
MLLHPRMDGGIALDSAVEPQQLRSHCCKTLSIVVRCDTRQMKRYRVAAGALATVVVLLALAAGYRRLKHDSPARAKSPAAPTLSAAAEEVDPSFLYGRITTVDGVTYEGRLRWGGVEEAFWGDYFNGAKKENPWVSHVPPEQLPTERRPIVIFGVEIAQRKRPIELGRLFMARFGDIARIESSGRNVQVTLKSGTVFDLDRFSASDFDDGVRVWDGTRGVADLDSLRIRAIELLPSPRPGAAPDRLHGTVRTRQGDDFTGFVQWDREKCVGSDELAGHTTGGERSVRFDAIRSIARRSHDSSLVTLLDGREVVLSGARGVGQGNRGVYVDDQRYGRVLVSWDAFERVDFSPGRSGGPAYGDFPPGEPITGSVTTRDGRRIAGRLVYDLDESEFTETLDAPSQGVDYTIPFGLVSSIVLPAADERGAPRARVTLHSGKQLQFECAGDLGQGNAGMLIFIENRQLPEYVPWTGVEQVVLDRPTEMYPPLGRR